MDRYRSNILTLMSLDAVLAAQVENTSVPPEIRVFASKAGPATAEYVRPDGSKTTLHSRYDPFDEAAGFAAGTDTEKLTTYIVLGFGLGYHIKALLDNMREQSRIIVIERHLEIIRAACENVDLAEVFASRRVAVVAGKSVPEIFNTLKAHSVRIFLDATYLVHRPSSQVAPEYYREVHEAFADYVNFGLQNIVTTVSIDLLSKMNTLMNLPYYAASPGIARYKDAYAGRPAIIVSAGPSLHRNIELLPSAEGRAVIIAVSTVFKPLLRRGIKPDFAVVLDYHPISRKYFEAAEGDEDVTLVADAKAAWEAVEAHGGPKAIIHNDALHHTLGKPPFHKGLVASGTTVAHSAFYFAEYIGADPIIFVGQDLAHPDGVTHVPGTAVHDIWAAQANRFNSIEVREWESILRMKLNLRKVVDVHGNEIYTDGQMFSYLQQFEANFYESRATVIDATEGGAAKKYTTAMTLKDALDRYATEPLSEKPSPPPETPDSTDADGRAEIDARLAEWISRMDDVRDFYDHTLGVLDKINKYWPDQEAIAPLLAEIEEVRKKVETYSDVNDLVRETAQADELRKIKADRAILSDRLDGLEKQRAQLDRDLEYVNGLRDAVDRIEKVFRRALERYREFDFEKRVFAVEREASP
jgi:hypothetical protein